MWFANPTEGYIAVCVLGQVIPLISTLSIRTLHQFLGSILFAILPGISHEVPTHLLLSASDGSSPPFRWPYLLGLAAIDVARRAMDSFRGDDAAHRRLSLLPSAPQDHATRRGQLQPVRPSSNQDRQGAYPTERIADMPRRSAGLVLLPGIRFPTLVMGGPCWRYLHWRNEQSEGNPEAK